MSSIKRRLLNPLLFVLTLSLALPPEAAGQVIEYYHLDALGSIRAVSNQAGDLVERHDYLPYGEECTTPPCAGVAGTNTKKFTGKERDGETGLDYFGARYYGPKLARFTNVDPGLDVAAAVLDPQQWNRYSYGLNNPYRFNDPDGRLVRQVTTTVTIGKTVRFGLLGPVLAGVAIGIAAKEGLEVWAFSIQANASLKETQDLAALENERILRELKAEVEARPAAGGGSALSGGGIGNLPPGSLGWRLRMQMASEAQFRELMTGGGVVIAGVGHKRGIDDIDRLLAVHGGQVSDWVKIKSSHFREGVVSFETHAYRNLRTGETLEAKTKFGDDHVF